MKIDVLDSSVSGEELDIGVVIDFFISIQPKVKAIVFPWKTGREDDF